jgi:hypothetical protein
MFKRILPILLVAFLVTTAQLSQADEPTWEYKVVILQGVTAGGTIEKDANGVYVDSLRTRALNRLAAEGWEVIAVLGAVATDHTVYLRRLR